MTLLDKPARSILDLSREASEDRYLLVAGSQEATRGNPNDLTTQFHRVAEDLGGSVRDALANMQAPASAAEAITMLERSRDELRAHRSMTGDSRSSTTNSGSGGWSPWSLPPLTHSAPTAIWTDSKLAPVSRQSCRDSG